MKVVGTGSPTMLTVRAKACEVRLLREVACVWRAEVLEAAADLDLRGGDEDGDGDRLDDPHEQLTFVAQLLDDLREPAPCGQPRELIGPTRFLAPILRSAASEAAQRLSEAVEAFGSGGGMIGADQLRALVDNAAASAATLIGVDYAENHATDR